MRKRGYTLIEVLIVVAILAILTLGAITALSGQRRRAEDAKMKADLDRLRIAFEDYYNDHNCYPPVAWFATATSCGSNLMAPYLQAIACDPHTGLPYQVQVDQTGCKWFRFSANLGTPEIQPGCTSGASCPLVATYSVGSGNIDPYAIPSPSPSGTPAPTATPTPTPTPTPGPSVSHLYYYCSGLSNCTSYDPTRFNCTPSYTDNPFCDAQNCASVGSCTPI